MGKPQTEEHKANLSKSISKALRAKRATGWSPRKPGHKVSDAQRKAWRINSQKRRDAKKAAKLNGTAPAQEPGQSFPLAIIPERMNGNGNGHVAVRKPAKSYYIPKSDASAKKMALAYELISAVRRIMES